MSPQSASGSSNSRTGTAYFLWLIGGYVGLHHLYLGRYAAAIVYGQTFGLASIAWLADLFAIPNYISPESKNATNANRGCLCGCVNLIWSLIAGSFRYVASFTLAHIYCQLLQSCWTVPLGLEDTRELPSLPGRLAAFGAMSVAAGLASHLMSRSGIAGAGAKPAALWACIGGAALFIAWNERQIAAGQDDGEELASTQRSAAFGAVSCWHIVDWLIRRNSTNADEGKDKKAKSKEEKEPERPKTARKDAPAKPVAADSEPAAISCMRKGSNIMGSVFLVWLFWGAVIINVVLHAEVAIDEKTGIRSATGTGTTKFGKYAYEHSDEVYANMKETWVQFEQAWAEIKKTYNEQGTKPFFDMVWKDDKEDYTTLGLDGTKAETITLSEVKSAYRQAAKETHPDKVRARGGSEADVEKAAEKFRRVQKAYENLCEKLGDGRSKGSGRGGDAGAAAEPAAEEGGSRRRRGGRRRRQSNEDEL